MNRSDLIERIYNKQRAFTSEKDIALAVGVVIQEMSEVLASGGRVEIRGFGSFSVRRLAPHVGRNPKTGDPVQLNERRIPRFKPGKALREKINKSMHIALEAGQKLGHTS